MLLEGSKKGVADDDCAYFLVFRFECGLRLEPNRDAFILAIDVHPLRDRGLAAAETSPNKETDEGLGAVGDLEHSSYLFFQIGGVLFCSCSACRRLLASLISEPVLFHNMFRDATIVRSFRKTIVLRK